MKDDISCDKCKTTKRSRHYTFFYLRKSCVRIRVSEATSKGLRRHNHKQKTFFGKHIQTENEGINIKKIIEETRKQYETSTTANWGGVEVARSTGKT